MKIIGIVFARMDSQRFPAKALFSFLGQPLVLHVLRRATLCKGLDEVILATTARPVDAPLVDIVTQHGFKVYRGSLADVGKRALDCALNFKADAFARINGDSPAIDIPLLDEGCEIMRSLKPDFVTNLLPTRTYPYGVAVEIIKTQTYQEICKQPRSEDEKEHLTGILYKNINNFNCQCLPSCEFDCSKFAATVDKIEDIDLLERSFQRFAFQDGCLKYKQIYADIL